MVSLFHRQTASTGDVTVKNYLDALSRELRQRLPEAETAEIIAETEAHLHDLIEDRVASGSAETDSVREAILGFGSPQEYARHAANGMMDSRSASGSRIGLRMLAAVIVVLAVSFTFPIGDSSLLPLCLNFLAYDQEPALRCLELGTCALLLTFLFLAFMGRRASTKFLLGCGAILLTSSVIAAGTYKSVLPSGQWVDRRQLPSALRYERHKITALNEDIRLLHAGIAAYGSGSSQTIIGTLKRGERYIVPGATQVTLYGIIHDLTATESAFCPIVRYEAQGKSYFRIWYGRGEYDTVASYAEARARWQKYSPKWLWKSVRREQEARERLRQYEGLECQPQQFRPDRLWWDDLWSLPFTAVAVLLDGLAASAGRRVALINRRRRRSRTA